MIEAIKKARRVITELTWLALEISTLVTVIKMIIDTF